MLLLLFFFLLLLVVVVHPSVAQALRVDREVSVAEDVASRTILETVASAGTFVPPDSFVEDNSA
jgi:hypothetical protein